MIIKKAILQFKTGQMFNKRDAEKLRGYFGSIYQEEDLFHNHKNDGVIYRMPLIQYKVIDGILSIIGFNEGINVLAEKFLTINRLIIGEKEIFHFETGFILSDEEFNVVDSLHEYFFDSFWLPVNQKNFNDYIQGKLDLNRVLQNNILTNFKGLGIKVESRIMVSGKFKENTVLVNDEKFFGFTGTFVANVLIPDCMSVGKNRATGFGVVRKVVGK